VHQTTAHKVADYFINRSHRSGDPLSNLKLQKLLYYAQAWYLAFHYSPLFVERIEAWPHGPTVPPVYSTYKKWEWQPITVDRQEPQFAIAIKDHLADVMQQYGRYNAFHLELLTHQEKPWRDARKGLPPDAPSNAVITHEAMSDFYRSQLHGKKPKTARN
jgi:uncharacterized phage-associated protein